MYFEMGEEWNDVECERYHVTLEDLFTNAHNSHSWTRRDVEGTTVEAKNVDPSISSDQED
jgi:hypothetical protein